MSFLDLLRGDYPWLGWPARPGEVWEDVRFDDVVAVEETGTGYDSLANTGPALMGVAVKRGEPDIWLDVTIGRHHFRRQAQAGRYRLLAKTPSAAQARALAFALAEQGPSTRIAT